MTDPSEPREGSDQPEARQSVPAAAQTESGIVLEGGPERRARLMRAIMDQTGIDETMIGRLVHEFYARVRKDALIGPIFAARVEDWDEHLAKLCDFWSSVALMSGRYHGQPMRVHLELPIESAHFDRWLDLFEATAREICPPMAAAHFIDRARRIADSFEMGIGTVRGEFTAPRHRARP